MWDQQIEMVYAIIPYIIVTSWITTGILASAPYFSSYELFNNNGFCGTNQKSALFIKTLSVGTVGPVTFLCVIIILTFLTYCYIKRNALEENVELNAFAIIDL